MAQADKYKMQAGDFSWPDGAYVAIVFNMSWESWPKALATANNRQRAGEVVPADAKYGRNPRIIYEHAYGETAGMQRLLDIWQRHGIPTSCYADGLNIHLYPELARAAASLGTEFLAQGWDHTYLWDQTVQEQIEFDRAHRRRDGEGAGQEARRTSAPPAGPSRARACRSWPSGVSSTCAASATPTSRSSSMSAAARWSA